MVRRSPQLRFIQPTEFLLTAARIHLDRSIPKRLTVLDRATDRQSLPDLPGLLDVEQQRPPTLARCPEPLPIRRGGYHPPTIRQGVEPLECLDVDHMDRVASPGFSSRHAGPAFAYEPGRGRDAGTLCSTSKGPRAPSRWRRSVDRRHAAGHVSPTNAAGRRAKNAERA